MRSACCQAVCGPPLALGLEAPAPVGLERRGSWVLGNLRPGRSSFRMEVNHLGLKCRFLGYPRV